MRRAFETVAVDRLDRIGNLHILIVSCISLTVSSIELFCIRHSVLRPCQIFAVIQLILLNFSGTLYSAERSELIFANKRKEERLK